MSKKNIGLGDIVKGIRTLKDLINEAKQIYPEIAPLLANLNFRSSVSADEIRKAIAFAVNKITSDPYFILGVRKDDPEELVDAVYKVKAKFYHPDNGKYGDKNRFLEIKEAYDKIKNAKSQDK